MSVSENVSTDAELQSEIGMVVGSIPKQREHGQFLFLAFPCAQESKRVLSTNEGHSVVFALFPNQSYGYFPLIKIVREEWS